MFFEFNHTPIPKQRPRFSKKNGAIYDPQSKELKECKSEAKQQMASQRAEMALESPISFQMTVSKAIPDSWPKKRKETLLNKPCTSRPDLDNYLKWYADVLNEIAYDDDKCISESYVKKIWGNTGKVEIVITPHHEQ
jgi:Holliday junction resolvase RusA-like endonuclease